MASEGGRVLVVGGGIVGSATALALARAGYQTTVVDPAPGAGASAGNAGLVVPSYATPMSTPANLGAGLRALGGGGGGPALALPLGPATASWLVRFALACRPGRVRRDTVRLHRLAQESHEAYYRLQSEGLDLRLRRAGWLWVTTRGSAGRLAADAARLRAAGATCDVVDADGVRALEPAVGGPARAGLWFPDESVVDPSRACAALLGAAVEGGAVVRATSVLEVDRREGRVRSVLTGQGRLEVDHVVLATGASTRAVGRMFGVRAPVEPGYGWSLTLAGGGVVQRALMDLDDHVVISPFGDAVRVTGGMEFGGRPGASPRPEALQHLRDVATRLVPRLAELEEVRSWRGARPMTPSGVPVVGRRRGTANVVVAAGHGPLGVTLAPSTAAGVLAVLGSTPSPPADVLAGR